MSASILFASGKTFSINPCKLSLTRDSFEPISGKDIEENWSLMIGFGVKNYTPSECAYRLTQQIESPGCAELTERVPDMGMGSPRLAQ